MTTQWYNRTQALKTYKPQQPLVLTDQKVYEYEVKIHNTCNYKNFDKSLIIILLNLEEEENVIDIDYVEYLGLKHVKNKINYVTEVKGVKLDNIENNIRLILNEIINGYICESYYTNTLDIYDSISDNCDEEPNVYKIIDQCIRLNNKRMLYYIIFNEDEEMADRVYELTRE